MMIVYFVAILLLGCVSSIFAQEDVAYKMQDLHKKISEGLIVLRKEQPACQQTVYSLLDQVGKLHSTAQAVHKDAQGARQELLTERAVNVGLRNELNTIKSKFMQTKAALESTHKKLAEVSNKQKSAEETAKVAAADPSIPNITKGDIAEVAAAEPQIKTSLKSRSEGLT